MANQFYKDFPVSNAGTAVTFLDTGRAGIGGAATATLNRYGAQGTWADDFDLGWVNRDAQFISMTKPGGSFAGAFMARLSDVDESLGQFGIALALVAVGVNDDTERAQPAYAAYFEARRTADAIGNAVGYELDAVQLGDFVPATPYGPLGADSGVAVGATFKAGGGVEGVNDATSAIWVCENGAQWGNFLLCLPNSLRVDPVTGNAEVIAMPPRYAFNWYEPSGGQAATIFSSMTGSTTKMRLIFEDGGAVFQRDDGYNANMTNAMTLRHAPSGTPANGIGVSHQYQVKTGVSTWKVGATAGAYAKDVTPGSEDFAYRVSLMINGQAPVNAFEVLSDTIKFGTFTDNGVIVEMMNGQRIKLTGTPV